MLLEFFDANRVQILMGAVTLIMFIIVLEMVRRRRLREDYSLLWLGMFGIMFVLSLLRDAALDPISATLGIAEPVNALFIIFFALLLLVTLQFSAVITRLARENKQAAQHIALLTVRIDKLESSLNEQD